jgi:PrtD family type I secretion system ABC transporter
MDGATIPRGGSRGRSGSALARALAGVRGGFAAACLFSFAINLLMLAGPLYMLQIFDRVLSSHSIETLVFLSLMVAGAFVVFAILDAARSVILARMGDWIERDCGGALLAALAGAAAERRVGNQPLRDLAAVRGFLSGPAVPALLDVPWTPVYLAIVFAIEPTLGWLALSGAGAMAALALLAERLTRRAGAQATADGAAALAWAETGLRAGDAVAAMGFAPALADGWAARNNPALDAATRAAARAALLTAMAKAVRLILQAAIFGLGAWLAIEGRMTSGAMVAAAILTARGLAPIDSAIATWRQAAQARDALTRVREAFETLEPAGPAPIALPAPCGALTVDGLIYQPPGVDAPVIRGVSFSLEPGESLAVIGPTAAGKTTLARLLVGSLTPSRGAVRLDGAEMSAWGPSQRRQFFGYLPQDVALLDGTVAEAVARNGPPDDAAVVAAARQAGAHDFILGLRYGYTTPVGPNGGALSGGQRQRIGLARALFGSPRLVVLDEPNASLDYEGEAALVRALAGLKARGATVVVIAHRPSIVRSVDKVLVLREGRAERFGPAADILPGLVQAQPHPAPEQAPPSIETVAAGGR